MQVDELLPDDVAEGVHVLGVGAEAVVDAGEVDARVVGLGRHGEHVAGVDRVDVVRGDGRPLLPPVDPLVLVLDL